MLDADLLRIQQYYLDRGYLARMRAEKPVAKDGYVEAHVQIARIGSDYPDFLPPGVAEEVRDKLRLQPGDYLRRSVLRDDLRTVAQACRMHGFQLNLQDNRKVIVPPDSPICALPEGVEVWFTPFDTRVDLEITELPPPHPNRPLDDELSQAVRKRDAKTVAALLGRGANPNSTYRYVYVAVDPKTGYCSLLLPAIGWIKIGGYCGSAVSHLAYNLYNSDLETTKALLDAGADPNVALGYSPTPLEFAVQHCDALVVKTLLDAGASVQTRFRQSPLVTRAATNVRVEALRMLLERKRPVDERDRLGETALICASGFPPEERGNAGRADQMACVKLLLDRGADVNARSAYGRTALMEAMRNENDRLADYLIARGADRSLRDADGKTASDFAEEARRQRASP
jgi:ankyrin repeat protein